MEKLTIGKMARINGITEPRLYDKINLIQPCEVNPIPDIGITTSSNAHGWI